MKARVTALDPAELAAHENLAALLFDRLVTLNDAGQPQASLAASWRHDADSRRWEFQLRPGVRFHDGSPLSASAAAASLERLGATAQGDTLVIRSEQPAPKMAAMLAGGGYSILKRNAEGAPVGTGPFRVSAWEPGRRVALAANDEYWGGRPYLDGVEIEMGRGAREQSLDFDLNKADLVELGIGDLRRAAQGGRKTWISAPIDLLALVFDGSVDDRTREAIALSIDRAAIHSVLLQKQGQATAALLPQWLSGYAFLFPDARDLERARSLARNPAPILAGYDALDSVTRAIAERVAVNAREAGITLRPSAGLQPAAVRLVRARIRSLDAGLALAALASALGLEAMAQAPADTPYGVERALLQGARVVPLFHLPEIYGLGSRVRNWAPSRRGVWKLESVWLAPERP
jgi:peptide/nickel transport system substrate-binding protein